LSERIGLTESEIAKSLRLDTMYHLAQTMPLDGDTHGVVANPHKFSLSTLERLIDTPSTLTTLGIAFTKEGGIVGTIDPAEFKKGYSRIIADIVKGPDAGGIDTRSLNKRADIDHYLEKKLGKDKPDKKKKGTFTSESLLTGGSAQPAPATPLGRKPGGPVIAKDSKYLPPSAFRLGTKNPRIKDVFREFRHLKVADYENTCGVMFRVLFEMMVTNHLDKTGKMQTLLMDLAKAGKIKNPKTHHPSMAQMMKFLMADSSITLPPQVRKNVNRMVDNPDSLLSFDEINGFVHDAYQGPTEKQLRKIWHMLEPLMKQMVD